ncbi:BASS family bile acid:Na+ symporter [Hasllibacter halocynthiae]|uniref:BASS family bile acid:Na+ symporter n=1 Tax=Hasllibacter halocynthiae TaxID=595589 RepID=A0A2T0X2G1_9RHOB|nr:bile acid:sodium symporter [Hasllibacter halocynthiae]PRY93044.1 BASS family bile acid:Na+ symporter [Hasllibacter halocynthiae]
MDLVLSLGLPLALAIIMLTLGLGLSGADFARVATRPRAFAIGFLAQVALVPALAYALLQVVPLDPALAFGMMILALSPGGATTNILTRFARGDVALSVSLTAVVSLLSVVTVPILVALFAGLILGEAAEAIDITALAAAMFLITTVPVLIGMAIRRLAPGFTRRIEPALLRLAAILFAVVLLAALATQWAVFAANLPVLGPLLLGWGAALLALGYALARLLGLDGRQASTISIEAGVQNGTVGITVASLIAGTAMPPFAVPSAVYGILMYVVALPAIALFLRRGDDAGRPLATRS